MEGLDFLTPAACFGWHFVITSLVFVCFCLNLTCGPHRIKHHLQLVNVMYSAIW